MTTDIDLKTHWEDVYGSKALEDVSWYQPTPITSLEFIEGLGLDTDASIIDIGGGDSYLVDHLLASGYSNISVLDISKAAIDRAKKRLGDRAKLVQWIESDINDFTSAVKYDVWHDRAAFHFLTHNDDISRYVETVSRGLRPFGSLILGTFSENGPTKCSGIDITQYSQESMSSLFAETFVKIQCTNIDHPTPFKTTQNFTFCSFKRRNYFKS
ncbi:MAG: 2-polyprenyl-3-methyl-5-hydroxy-6-metoxy-1,4-benzoquinol methylase [Bacteroidia bacterium]|jgi:2-polyprenyl-3-methyl-5-hydroxy-6-metoxy-1,4-benzoquinol methylase